MNTKKLMGAVGLAILFGACATPTPPSQSHDIYLVRHAEKESGPDPVLTAEGQERAEALAGRLTDAGITHVHSTDTRRTRLTAAPVTDLTGRTVEIYDPRDLEGFAGELLAERGSHIVVGHSNTTPQLAEALGCGPQAPIVEATEYDRLYVVSVGRAGVDCRVERFGR